LHHQQFKKDKENVDVAPTGKISADTPRLQAKPKKGYTNHSNRPHALQLLAGLGLDIAGIDVSLMSWLYSFG